MVTILWMSSLPQVWRAWWVALITMECSRCISYWTFQNDWWRPATNLPKMANSCCWSSVRFVCDWSKAVHQTRHWQGWLLLQPRVTYTSVKYFWTRPIWHPHAYKPATQKRSSAAAAAIFTALEWTQEQWTMQKTPIRNRHLQSTHWSLENRLTPSTG